MLALDGSRKAGISMASRIGQPKYLVAKSVLYEAGDWGKVWRVVSGGLRLDSVVHQQNRFASLALVGDLVGLESLVLGHYGYRAQALVPTVLLPMPPDLEKTSDTVFRRSMVQQLHETGRLLRLREGAADDRIGRLLMMLEGRSDEAEAGDRPPICLPSLKDMSEIVDLTMESVSRVVTKFRQQQVLMESEVGRRHFNFQRHRLGLELD